MGDLSSGYPKALSYSIKELADQMSRIGVKITPDRTTGIKSSDVITFKLPNNSLIDMRSLNMFYKFTPNSDTTNGIFLHPRYSSSLIERISIIINGTTVDILPQQNFLYNTLMDLEGSSSDQMSKRSVCEWFDPSIKVTQGAITSTEVALTGSNWLTVAVADKQNKEDGAISNWLGFCGSCNPSVISTEVLGDVFIQIQTASKYVLPHTISAAVVATPNPDFTLDDVYMTCDVISFVGNTYYDLLLSKLSSGLRIGYYSYLNARFPSVAKGTGVNVSWNISGRSIDQLIATYQLTDATSTSSAMVVYGSRNETTQTGYTMAQLASNPLSYTGSGSGTLARNVGYGDGFMNSYYFIRNGINLLESKFTINNRPLNYGGLTPKEVFLQTLLSLGYNSIDLGSNGLNLCIWSLQHFLKYYFAHIIDLTIQDTRDFFISGLDSTGNTTTIGYEAKFTSTNTTTIVPILFARLSKELRVFQGRQIQVV